MTRPATQLLLAAATSVAGYWAFSAAGAVVEQSTGRDIHDQAQARLATSQWISVFPATDLVIAPCPWAEGASTP